MPSAALAEMSNDKILDAIKQVESGGNTKAIGDGGEAVSAYQIRPIFVKEVNRISGRSFKNADRRNEAKAREMVSIWLAYRFEYGDSVENACRRYNAGSNWQGKAAASYWKKIQKVLNR
jgi:hypothetical protein